MKRNIVYILSMLLTVSCSIREQNKDERIDKRYYYKALEKKENEPHYERLYSYITRDISWVGDTMFVKRISYNTDFEINSVHNEVFFKKGEELYFVRGNGTRLFLSTLVNECVEYLADPDFMPINIIFGYVHCYLGKDTIKINEQQSQVRHKFLVQRGVWKDANDDWSYSLSEKDIGVKEYLYYYYYDEDFVLISTEYVGHLRVYEEIKRIENVSALYSFVQQNKPVRRRFQRTTKK